MSSVEELIRDNPLFKAYSKEAKLWQILGYPPILSQIFGNQWLDGLKKLDYGPFYPKFLAFLAGDIEPLINLKGFDAIKQKLSEVNEGFFPTIFEIEIASLFERNNFLIELENTFSVYNRRREEKHPDLRVKIKGNWVYYEMTDVLDYSDRKHFQSIYNNLSAFWEAMKFKLKKDLSLTVLFRNMPSLNEIKEITDYIAVEIEKNQFPINLGKDNVSLNVTHGNACKILLPVNVIERKLRDKYDQELDQFDPKEINVVAIDTTALIGEFGTFSKIIKGIFEENQTDIVNGVVLVSKRYVVREGRIALEKGFCIVGNKYAKKFDFFPFEHFNLHFH